MEIIKDMIKDIIKTIVHNPPNNIYVVTFGLWAGLSKEKEHLNDTAVLLHTIEKKNINANIIVGIPPYSSCKNRSEDGEKIYEKCEFCEHKYDEMWERYIRHVDKWSKINWYIKSQTHAKFILLEYEDKIISHIGSKNLNDSNWDDITLKIESMEIGQELIQRFNELKEKDVVIPFGKHKDMSFNKLPTSYLEWIKDNVFEFKHFAIIELIKRE